MLQAFGVATILVALAELGDKTQMLTLVLASRYPARRVLVGVFVAVLGLQALAVLAGGLVGSLLPTGVLTIVTVVLFIAFGVWSFVDAAAEDDVDAAPGAGRGSLATIAIVSAAFFIAELGDKTQVLTLAIAADPGAAARTLSLLGIDAQPVATGIGPYLGVWLGSTAGMMLVNGVAIALGAALGSRLPRATVARISGVIFILFGILVAGAYLVA